MVSVTSYYCPNRVAQTRKRWKKGSENKLWHMDKDNHAGRHGTALCKDRRCLAGKTFLKAGLAIKVHRAPGLVETKNL